MTVDLPEETKLLCHEKICVSNGSVTVLCLNVIGMIVSKINKAYFAHLTFSLVPYVFPGVDVAINIEDWQHIEVPILQKSACLWVRFVILKNLKRKNT